MLDRVLTDSVHLGFARVFDAGLSCVAETAFAGCRWEYQCSLPQWRTEQVLADRFAELGGTVERGVSVVSLTKADDRVEARLEGADGTIERS